MSCPTVYLLIKLKLVIKLVFLGYDLNIKCHIENFNIQNYQLWKMKMEDYMYLPLGEKTKQTMAMKDEKWEVIDIEELGTILLFLDSSVNFNISKEKTTEGVMSTLGKLYEKPSASNKVFLMKRLFNMNMLKGGSVADHLKEFNTLTG